MSRKSCLSSLKAHFSKDTFLLQLTKICFISATSFDAIRFIPGVKNQIDQLNLENGGQIGWPLLTLAVIPMSLAAVFTYAHRDTQPDTNYANAEQAATKRKTVTAGMLLSMPLATLLFDIIANYTKNRDLMHASSIIKNSAALFYLAMNWAVRGGFYLINKKTEAQARQDRRDKALATQLMGGLSERHTNRLPQKKLNSMEPTGKMWPLSIGLNISLFTLLTAFNITNAIDRQLIPSTAASSPSFLPLLGTGSILFSNLMSLILKWSGKTNHVKNLLALPDFNNTTANQAFYNSTATTLLFTQATAIIVTAIGASNALSSETAAHVATTINALLFLTIAVGNWLAAGVERICCKQPEQEDEGAALLRAQGV